MSQRSRVINLYKHLQYLGREYPVNPDKFRATCNKVFKKNSTETDPVKIEEMIAKGFINSFLSLRHNQKLCFLQAITLSKKLKLCTHSKNIGLCSNDITMIGKALKSTKFKFSKAN